MPAIKLILRATLICKLGMTFYFGLRTGVQGEKVGRVLCSQLPLGVSIQGPRAAGWPHGPNLTCGKGLQSYFSCPQTPWSQTHVEHRVEVGPPSHHISFPGAGRMGPFPTPLHVLSESFCSLLVVLHLLYLFLCRNRPGAAWSLYHC